MTRMREFSKYLQYRILYLHCFQVSLSPRCPEKLEFLGARLLRKLEIRGWFWGEGAQKAGQIGQSKCTLPPRAVRIRKRTHWSEWCLIVLGTCNTLQYFWSHKTFPWQLDWLRMSTTTQILLKSTVMNLGIRGSLREMMEVGLKICCYCWWWSFCWWLWLGYSFLAGGPKNANDLLR